jgi:hypothetical protein
MDTPPLSIHLLRVNKAHELLHGVRAGSLDDVGHFPPFVEHVFGQKLSYVRGCVKVFHIAKKLLT